MKKILLAVCGKTPQIITETIYALWEQGDLPTDIYIITTKAGKDAISSSLLHSDHGMFYKFCTEYNIDASTINFSYQNIIVPHNLDNREMEDIRDEDDSRIFLQHCLEKTFTVTENSEDTVFFSIAAGRKTMGASLTLAAQYYGREQDKIYHVLVKEEFEYSRDFYYPPKKKQFLELLDSKGEKSYKSTEYAKISLINIPFFSIRERLGKEMLENPVSPGELLSLLQKNASPCLKLNVMQRTIEWKNKTVQLPEAWFALYWFFANKKKEIQEQNINIADSLDYTMEVEEVLNLNKEIASLYYKVIRYLPNKENPTSDTGIIELNAVNLRSSLSKIKGRFEEEFGSEGASQIVISSTGKRSYTRYGILLDSYLIEIIEE